MKTKEYHVRSPRGLQTDWSCSLIIHLGSGSNMMVGRGDSAAAAITAADEAYALFEAEQLRRATIGLVQGRADTD